MPNKYTLTKADKNFIIIELYYDLERYIQQIQRTVKQVMSMLSYTDFISSVC